MEDPKERSHREAFLTPKQTEFLKNLSQNKSLSAGQKSTLEGLVRNILDQKEHDKFIENIKILRKYLSTLASSEKSIRELNFIFNLE